MLWILGDGVTAELEARWSKHIAEIDPLSGDCALVDDDVLRYVDLKIKRLEAALRDIKDNPDGALVKADKALKGD